MTTKVKDNMNIYSMFYCPNCKSVDLMVNDDDKHAQKKPYTYYCTDCNQEFKITRLTE